MANPNISPKSKDAAPFDGGPSSEKSRERTIGTDVLMGSLVGRSKPMQELARKLERVVATDVTVAIFGETGTGKELVARALHDAGPRRNKPFVAINCAAIAESLQDAELFGHERGAFTGALAQRRGCFEQAHGGTLFLDELGDMSPSTQARMLRTLQERTIRRVGGTDDVPVDVRIICATRRDLRREMAAGRFREDLYFRLVVYPVELPPLRERRGDLPLLVPAILRKLVTDPQQRPPQMKAEALDALARYHWPGNVRELVNVVHRSLLHCDGAEIAFADLPSDLFGRSAPASPAATIPAPASSSPASSSPASSSPGSLAPSSVAPSSPVPSSPAPSSNSAPAGLMPEDAEAPSSRLRDLERSAIDRALAAAGGHVGNAAKILGISRATLYRRLSVLLDEKIP
ncbi:MAG: sigma-54 dependent transcriptional regulator [Byssovorax sp.]